MFNNFILGPSNQSNGLYDPRSNGEPSDTPGPCKCGYKHWCNGEEKDFVLKLETPLGIAHLGVNTDDNPYELAEAFVEKYDLDKSLNGSKGIVSKIVDEIVKLVSEIEPYSIDNKPKINSTLKHSSPILSSNENHQPVYITEEKDKEDHDILVKSNQEEVSREKMEQLRKKKEIELKMEMDKKETQARLQQYRDINHSSPNKPPPGHKMVVENGAVRYVPISEASPPSSPFSKHNTRERQLDIHRLNQQQEIQKLMSNEKKFQMDNDSDVGLNRKLRKKKAQKEAIEALQRLSISEQVESTFPGEGNLLIHNQTTTTTVISQSRMIEIDPTKPQTSIRVRLHDGSLVTIKVNHDNTIGQLMEHVGCLSGHSSFSLKDISSRPPRDLNDLNITIEQAKLIQGNVLQSAR